VWRRVSTILWIIAAILVIAGIVTLLRGGEIAGIVLIIVGLLVGRGWREHLLLIELEEDRAARAVASGGPTRWTGNEGLLPLASEVAIRGQPR
jgi:hypothetical protein